MNLYKISQEKNCGYDTYDSAVVAAKSEDEARLIHPGWYESTSEVLTDGTWYRPWTYNGRTHVNKGTWAEFPSDVVVEFLGQAAEGIQPGTIVASFNAG
jgi:hypothetical protein